MQLASCTQCKQTYQITIEKEFTTPTPCQDCTQKAATQVFAEGPSFQPSSALISAMSRNITFTQNLRAANDAALSAQIMQIFAVTQDIARLLQVFIPGIQKLLQELTNLAATIPDIAEQTPENLAPIREELLTLSNVLSEKVTNISALTHR